MNLDDLPKILDDMLSKQKEKRAKTFVARYKGKNLITRSGKSSWKAVNHAKAAITLHFKRLESAYVYDYNIGERWPQINYDKFSLKERNERQKQFRENLFKLIEIVELTD